MLACDLILAVRSSGSLSVEQVRQLERMAFGCGQPSREQLEVLLVVDQYVMRADPSWTAVLARAAEAAKHVRPVARFAAAA